MANRVSSWRSGVQTLVLLALIGRPLLAQAQCGKSGQCTTAEHTVTFQNNCAYPIWIANAGNAFGGAVMGGKACTSPTDCCVTLADGTQDCAGVNCVNGTCTQVNCTSSSNCPNSSSGLVSCNVPQGVTCTSDNNCATYGCTKNSDCPPGASCGGSGTCINMCQSGKCACGPGAACPSVGTVCDLTPNTQFGFCAGGACQYNGLVPENGPGTSTSPQWQLAAACSTNAQCASGQTCKSGQCTCAANSDCAALGGACSNGVCVGQSATLCMPQGWGGRIWGRTGCSTVNGGFQCQTGECGQSAAGVLQCTNLAQGVAQTATGITLFEGTWDSNQTDFWDISLVNGYNIPMQVGACGASGKASCTFAGEPVSAAAVGCTSDLNASCPALLSIGGQCNCVSNSDCPSGQTCGANNLCSGTGSCTAVCIDPGDYCKSFGLFANNPVIAAPSCLQCNSAVSSLNATTYADYYNCVGPLATLSCNNAAYVCFSDNDCPYSGQTCQSNVCTPVNSLNGMAKCVGGQCNSGVNQVAQYSCQTVQGTQLCLPNAPTSANQSGCCGPYNSGWLTAMQAANGTSASGTCQPGSTAYTAAFKTACPTVYSYQFDDPSSSYQCSDSNSEVNYLVTFCASAAPAAPKPKKGL